MTKDLRRDQRSEKEPKAKLLLGWESWLLRRNVGFGLED